MGFEPTERSSRSLIFKTAPLNHSGTHPAATVLLPRSLPSPLQAYAPAQLSNPQISSRVSRRVIKITRSPAFTTVSPSGNHHFASVSKATTTLLRGKPTSRMRFPSALAPAETATLISSRFPASSLVITQIIARVHARLTSITMRILSSTWKRS